MSFRWEAFKRSEHIALIAQLVGRWLELAQNSIGFRLDIRHFFGGMFESVIEQPWE